MDWKPASKQEALDAIEEDWIGIDPSVRIELSRYLVEPWPSFIERFGRKENAFIVARRNEAVVFFDDIEEIFGTAFERGGELVDPASYGNVVLALRELARLPGNGS